MRRKARDWIPENILAAARQAGLSTPLWYIGRTRGKPSPNHKTLSELAEEGRRKADEAIYGHSVIGPEGQRVDPATVEFVHDPSNVLYPSGTVEPYEDDQGVGLRLTDSAQTFWKEKQRSAGPITREDVERLRKLGPGGEKL